MFEEAEMVGVKGPEVTGCAELGTWTWSVQAVLLSWRMEGGASLLMRAFMGSLGLGEGYPKSGPEGYMPPSGGEGLALGLGFELCSVKWGPGREWEPASFVALDFKRLLGTCNNAGRSRGRKDYWLSIVAGCIFCCFIEGRIEGNTNVGGLNFGPDFGRRSGRRLST